MSESSTRRPRALVIAKSDPAGDPRPHRMVSWLRQDFDLRVLSTRSEPLPGGIPCVPLPGSSGKSFATRLRGALRLALRLHEARLWSPSMRALALQEAALRPDFIAVHDLNLLPLALAIRGPRGGPARLLFDAREYYPRHFEHSQLWRLSWGAHNRYLCRTYLRDTDVLATVNAGLAAEYTREFGVPCGVLPSYADPHELSPSPTHADRVRLIHHGNATPNRRIELMIDLMRLLPSRFSLDLMLVGMASPYGRSLRGRAHGLANVAFRDPVPFSEIIRVSNAYDIGVFLCPPTTFNLRHALPNKFFEFIQARLAVAIGPSVEMAPYVARHACGVVADDFTPASLAAKLAALTTADIDRLKAASHHAAAQLTTNLLRDRVLSVALRGAGVEAFPP